MQGGTHRISGNMNHIEASSEAFTLKAAISFRRIFDRTLASAFAPIYGIKPRMTSAGATTLYPEFSTLTFT